MAPHRQLGHGARREIPAHGQANPPTTLSADQWDGYRADQTALFTHLRDHDLRNTVFLTGACTRRGRGGPVSRRRGAGRLPVRGRRRPRRRRSRPSTRAAWARGSWPASSP
ncbi:alkaline phosphatase D family protein [Yinghuangia aomiensis]